MAYQDFMNKLRQWDNKTNQWFFRHFYLLFFQIILVLVFLMFFVVTINVINHAPDPRDASRLEQILVSQNVIGLMLTFLVLLNSFWMLFMLAGLIKVRGILKNIDFNLSKRQSDRRYEDTF